MEQEKMTLGKRIAMLRKNQGWTQEQLGEKVGVSAQAVSKWENDIACPDIATLPLLADLFGVTVDELLGVKPIEPHVVILDKEPESEKNNKGVQFSIHRDDGHWGAITLCITAILICVMLILRSMTPLFNRADVGVWNYIWPLLVFGLGLASVREDVVFGVAAMAFGAYELVWFGWGVPFEIQWYVVVLILALTVLIKILLQKLGLLQKKNKKFVEVEGNAPNRVCNYSDEGNFIRAEMSFGHNSITYPYDTLNGMKLETNFGDHEIDLRSVRNFNNALMEVEVNFGNVIITLPPCVRVVKSADTAFAALRVIGEPDPAADQTVYLKGDVNFGNLEIRY